MQANLGEIIKQFSRVIINVHTNIQTLSDDGILDTPGCYFSEEKKRAQIQISFNGSLMHAACSSTCAVCEKCNASGRRDDSIWVEGEQLALKLSDWF